MAKKNEYRPRKMPFWVHESPERIRIWCINEARRKRDFESRALSEIRRSAEKGDPDD